MNKQIEEMARSICNCYYRGICKMDGNSCDLECGSAMNAYELYNAGYRKASEVARETVKAIKAEVSKKEFWVSEFDGCEYGGYVILTTDLEDIIRRYMFDTYEEAELKKKYAEGKG